MNYKESPEKLEIAPEIIEKTEDGDLHEPESREEELSQESAAKIFKKIAELWHKKEIGSLVSLLLTFEHIGTQKIPFTKEIEDNNFMTIFQSILSSEGNTQMKKACLGFVGYLMYSSDEYIIFFLTEDVLTILQEAMKNDFCIADLVCSILFNITVNDDHNVIDTLVEGEFDFSPVFEFLVHENNSSCFGIKNFFVLCSETPLAQHLASILIDAIASGASNRTFHSASMILLGFLEGNVLSDFCRDYCNEKGIAQFLATKLDSTKDDPTITDDDLFGITALLSSLIQSADFVVDISKLEELICYTLKECQKDFAYAIHLLSKIIDSKQELADTISEQFIETIHNEFDNILFFGRDECIVFLSVYASNCNNEKFEALATSDFLVTLIDVIDSDSTTAVYILSVVKRALEQALAKGPEKFEELLDDIEITEKLEYFADMNEEEESKETIEISRELLSFIHENYEEPED